MPVATSQISIYPPKFQAFEKHQFSIIIFGQMIDANTIELKGYMNRAELSKYYKGKELQIDYIETKPLNDLVNLLSDTGAV